MQRIFRIRRVSRNGQEVFEYCSAARDSAKDTDTSDDSCRKQILCITAASYTSPRIQLHSSKIIYIKKFDFRDNQHKCNFTQRSHFTKHLVIKFSLLSDVRSDIILHRSNFLLQRYILYFMYFSSSFFF